MRFRLRCSLRELGDVGGDAPSFRSWARQSSMNGRPSEPKWFLCVPDAAGPLCMSKSGKYQRFAEECLEIASTAKDVRVKAALMHMAQVWFRLAADYAKEVEEEKTD
jgi:hypothetical protein